MSKKGKKSIGNAIYQTGGFLYPFAVIVTFTVLAIESFTYSGFVAKYFFIEAKSIMTSTVLFGILVTIIRKTAKKTELFSYSLFNLIFQLNYLLLPVLLIIYYILFTLESTNYTNYVFSTYHIMIDNLYYLVIFSVFNIFVGVLLKDNNIFSYKIGPIKIIYPNKKIFSSLFIILLVYYSLSNLTNTVKKSSESNMFILGNRQMSYEEKMKHTWGLFYKYMLFIKQNTPEDSAIAIPPPIRPWLSEGNSVLVRYFLYPRYLVTVENENGSDREPDYYMLAKGLWKAYNEEDYGWPRMNLKAEGIYYFDPQTEESYFIKNDYDFGDEKNRISWGLIKVAR